MSQPDHAVPAPPPAAGSPASDGFLAKAFAALVLTFAILALMLNLADKRGAHMDYRNLDRAAVRVDKGVSPYTNDNDSSRLEFIYPPPAAALLGYLHLGGRVGMLVSLIGAAALAWVVSVLLAGWLAAGQMRRVHPMVWILPVVLTAPFVFDNFNLGQPNLFLLACLLGLFACLRTNRPIAGGFLLATAAAMKAFPIAALAYLLYRRLWRAAGAALAWLAVLLLLFPAPLRGFRGNLADLRTWTLGMTRVDANGIGQRPARSYTYQNQSLFGVANRFLRPINANSDHDGQTFVNVVDWSPRATNIAILAIAGLLGLGYIAVMPPRRRRTPATDVIEWAMLLELILIASPYVFGYFNVWSLLTLTVMTSAFLSLDTAGARWAMAGAGVVVALLWLAALPFVMAFRPLQCLGNVFWAHLVLLGTLAALMVRERRRMNSPASAIVSTAPAVHASLPARLSVAAT